ncbi:MAG: alpha/beta fold hydrolase [Acidimicrobiia bacterium]|nr:alpha/beta fold hydrolase [Acidimicrobiia bacterium]
MSGIDTKHGSLWVHKFEEGSPIVVALHGFTLHGASFERFATEFGSTVLAPDLPGHGQTKIDPITIDTTVSALAELLRRTPESPILLGYSQGGRVAVQVALRHPELISGLVLVSTSPGLSERARKLRIVADDALASRIERIGTELFIEEWLANPLTATDKVDTVTRQADLTIRLESSADGLAAALRGIGQASVPSVSDQLSKLKMPVAIVAGRRDEKYSALAIEMSGGLSQRPVLVNGAGHNVILEEPGAVADVVRKLAGQQTG